MTKRFKNALCLEAIPDIGGYGYHGERSPYQVRCHRRTGHPGRHRVCFRDGGIREWAEGELGTVLTKEPS